MTSQARGTKKPVQRGVKPKASKPKVAKVAPLQVPEDAPIAIISLYDKRDVFKHARELTNLGYQIVSSGGTAAAIREGHIAGNEPAVPVLTIAELRFQIFFKKIKALGSKLNDRDGFNLQQARRFFETVFPTEMLGHRVATLHAEVQGGILAADDMVAELAELGYRKVEVVFVDLYPLAEEARSPNANLRSVQDKIDIGGVTLLRGAAKNNLIVGSSYADRLEIMSLLANFGDLVESERTLYAAKTFARMAEYDLIAARYLDPKIDGFVLEQDRKLSYGENAQQAPSYLWRKLDSKTSLPTDLHAVTELRQEQGALMSYNNACDASRLIRKLHWMRKAFKANGVQYLTKFKAIVVKHNNCAGIGVSGNLSITALRRMLDGDPIANHGGLVIFNDVIDVQEAEILLHHGMPEGQMRLLDGIIAPRFTDEAKAILRRKGENKLRLLSNSELLFDDDDWGLRRDTTIWTQIRGGFVSQPEASNVLDLGDLSQYEQYFMPRLDDRLIVNMCIAQTASHNDNSNTITAAKNEMLLVSATGQQDRWMAAELLVAKAKRAGHDLTGAVASSDSFFPFPDAPETLANAGIGVIMSTSGALTGDAEFRKMLLRQRKEGFNCPGVVLIPDSIGRGFRGHSG